jgi:Fe-S cluster biogenesis protein NfuA
MSHHDSAQQLADQATKPDSSEAASEPNETSESQPIHDRVKSVIEEMINPAVAMHGGFVSLVDVKDNIVYVSMGGGCQGCAASQMTLRSGIEAAIREAVPEVTEVRDATDHEAGENPFYR